MDFLIANLSIVIALVIYGVLHLYNKWIHQHNAWFFIVGFILSITLIIIEIPVFELLINHGHLSLGLFLLVMFAGTLKRKSILYKKILLVRGDLAILGFIFLIPHGAQRLTLALNGYQSTGLIAAIIMLPLTLSSFMIIRKKIRPDKWKKLHKLAYIAYIMIYIHIGFEIFLNPLNFYITINESSILFHLLFIIYFVLLVHKIVVKQKKKNVS